MDFFERQAHALKQSRRLAWLFSLAVLLAVVVNNLIWCPVVACFRPGLFADVTNLEADVFSARVGYLVVEFFSDPVEFAHRVFGWGSLLAVTPVTLVMIAGGCFFKMRELSAGGSVVAGFLGGRRVPAKPESLSEQRLRNVVEEMAIASGLPVPEIYVLDCERGINSFAAGHTRDDVALGLTRGAVELLTRDELQGVVAHEFSHILNGDTRFNMRVIGLAHGLFWPTLVGRLLIYGQEQPVALADLIDADEQRSPVMASAPLGVLLVGAGMIYLPLVRLIKSAICRQREWLADAAAVQFTRNPAGIAGALKKVGGLAKEGRLNTPHAEVASHLYLVNCLPDPWFAFLGTHPPLKQRVQRLEPAFDGNFPGVKMLAPNEAEREENYAELLGRMVAAGQTLPVAPAFREVTPGHLQQAVWVRRALPEDVKQAMRTADGAACLMYALLLSAEEPVRQAQTAVLHEHLTPEDEAWWRRLQPLVEGLDDRFKLPLAECAVPALREFQPPARLAFNLALRELVACNGSLGLFEYALNKLVARQLNAFVDGPATGGNRGGRVADVAPECAALLSALAYVGADDEAAARKAFAQGVEFLDVVGAEVKFLTRAEWNLAGVDAALDKLAAYHEPMRRNIVLACGKTVAADGTVTVREAELLRAIADALGCPMPPFVESIWFNELTTAGAGAGA